MYIKRYFQDGILKEKYSTRSIMKVYKRKNEKISYYTFYIFHSPLNKNLRK